MSLRLLFGFAALTQILTGCAHGPIPPDWQISAHHALTGYSQAFLSGRDRIARQNLAIARQEVRRTGDAAQMGRVELAACATRIASLDADSCPEFLPLSRDANDELRSYAAYLEGRSDAIDSERLPETQRRAYLSTDVPAALREIDDPLSRLVAAAVLFRRGRLPPSGVNIAIETSSAQGWQRALLAWLGVARELHTKAGDAQGAAALQRRIERVLARPATAPD